MFDIRIAFFGEKDFRLGDIDFEASERGKQIQSLEKIAGGVSSTNCNEEGVSSLDATKS